MKDGFITIGCSVCKGELGSTYYVQESSALYQKYKCEECYFRTSDGFGKWAKIQLTASDYFKADSKAIEDKPTDELSEVDKNVFAPVEKMAKAIDADLENQHDSGVKLDNRKIRPYLVLGEFSNALELVCDVGTFGADKYTDNGWVDVPDNHKRYTDAMLRHFLQEAKGELTDKESKIRHSAHIAWNALVRLEIELRDELISRGLK